jgi:hypothetical protein
VLADPYDDNYPQPFVQSYSHIDPDHQDPCSESLSPSRKRERSRAPPSLNGGVQSNEPPSKRRKRDRVHKKKEVRKKARAEPAPAAVYSRSFVPTLNGSTKLEHGNHGVSNDLAAPRRLQVDDPIYVPHGPTHRIASDSPAPPYLQYFHAAESSYAAILCRDTAHWSTMHHDDIFVPTSERLHKFCFPTSSIRPRPIPDAAIKDN